MSQRNCFVSTHFARTRPIDWPIIFPTFIITTIAFIFTFILSDLSHSQEGKETIVNTVSERAFPADSALPVPSIDFWYGNYQNFGRPGVSQKWINVVGRVSPPENILSLTFTLNDMPGRTLTVGPDRRRLVSPGDFNIEIDGNHLKKGKNLLMVTATDLLNQRTRHDVRIIYDQNTWPLPYTVNWHKIKNINEAVQVVDGFWVKQENGLRTHPDYIGYDRVIAIGDFSWRNYEVTAAFIIHSIDTIAWESSISVGPAFGINLYWLGHTDSPRTCRQPHCGWEPFGASFWFQFKRDGQNGWRIINPHPDGATPLYSFHIEMNKTYWLRVRVRRTAGRNCYRLKVWENGPSGEPNKWMLKKRAGSANLSHGSFLVVAHHVDMTVGSVRVKPTKIDMEDVLSTLFIK